MPGLEAAAPDALDGREAWARLLRALALSTVGGVGMWSVVVALPAVQADFGVARGGASLPYTLQMIGVGFGGILMGRLADRFGIIAPSSLGILLLGLGYLAAAAAPTLLVFALVHGLLIGVGCSASFGPLLAHVSLWFVRRRGIAVAICASGNYLAGAIWPPIVQHLVAAYGWRTAHLAIGLACLALMLPLVPGLRRPPPRAVAGGPAPGFRPGALPVGPRALQTLLILAGLGCCVAMAMPQVHIVAYCGDLGYGVARGAEMLSIMLGLGIVSRLASGFVADRIGGLATLLVGSLLQGATLVLYTLFDGLTSLYIISGLFGLVQGGIVPSYAIIVREYFPASQAGARVGICIMATLFGMALGGWLSGVIFDWTGSYRAAFLNGIAFNLMNGAIALGLLASSRRAGPGRLATSAA
ncbi:MAG: MFS transporter [Methylobacteriaceae bacterium]|nr:MFS transporter [Methylobacteriaceae bacterium]